MVGGGGGGGGGHKVNRLSWNQMSYLLQIICVVQAQYAGGGGGGGGGVRVHNEFVKKNHPWLRCIQACTRKGRNSNLYTEFFGRGGVGRKFSPRWSYSLLQQHSD